MSGTWYRYDAQRQCLVIALHVQPNAGESTAVGVHGDALKLKVAAPAVDSRANAALVAFLGAALRVPRGAITLRRGAASRRKVVEVSGGPELVTAIRRLVSG